MGHSAFAKAWNQGRPAYGGWITGDSDVLVRAVIQAGFDWVGLDCQHGAMDEVAAARVIRGLQGSPAAVLVRVGENSSASIGRVLDAGADGVVVPMVNSADEAKQAVRGCRYPPHGVRSFGPTRRDLSYPTAELEARADCFVMIETEAGLVARDEILSVPGVSGVFVGPSDLSVGLGLPPQDAYTTDQIVESLQKIRRSCERAGVAFGIFSNGPDSAVRWAAQGCTIIAVGSELGLLNAALSQALQQVLGGAAAPNAAAAATGPYGA